MRPQRLFTVLTAVAAVTFAAPVARAAELQSPVLWEGTIVGADSQPASGTEVVAFARPSGGDVAASDAPLVPVARAVTDGTGHYVLRSGNTSALQTVQTDSGWTNVMVAAFGRDGGFSLATDSIAWEPGGGFHATVAGDNPNRGRWLTTPAERAAAESGTLHATAAPDPDAVARDRPAVMTLTTGPDRPIKAQAAKPPPLRQEGMCAGPTKTQQSRFRTKESLLLSVRCTSNRLGVASSPTRPAIRRASRLGSVTTAAAGPPAGARVH